MDRWREKFLFFAKNKIYVWMLSLTAVFSYGFLMTHQTVGIDDTPYAYYFEEGLAAIVGRWVFFLVNKMFRVSDFSPFITDLAGVLILMAAVTVWCALLYSILRDRVPVWGYLFFSCIFFSCPLLSEVYTYYLHNGVSLGYLCTGISLCFYRELLESGRRRMLFTGLGTSVFLWVALGCYESFMVVWLLGIFLVLLTERYGGIRRNMFLALCKGVVAAVAAILLRSLMIAAVTGIFGLGGLRDEAVQRSVTEMASWMLQPGASAEFAMALKRIFVMYGVFAYAYYPIFVFVLAAAVMLLLGACHAVRHKDVWCFLLTLGCFFVSFLLVVIEGSATLYRSAQFLPVVCGYGALAAVFSLCRLQKWLRSQMKDAAWSAGLCRLSSGALIFGLCAILWNQCFDMNRWFYVDYLKYEDAKALVGEIAGELEKSFDTSKPVVFTGTYQPPRGIIGDAFVGYGSETFFKMNAITRLVDGHLLEKFYREYGVWVAQTPALSVVDWGINAFENDGELVRFFAMHGYSIQANMDARRFEEAQLYSVGLPGFPREGSIVDMGEYIIVHF